jgi:hypothetical protein
MTEIKVTRVILLVMVATLKTILIISHIKYLILLNEVTLVAQITLQQTWRNCTLHSTMSAVYCLQFINNYQLVHV